jgi:5-dehydro-2-deoxygluconokinase
VFNVLGAGDAFMAGFLRGWLRDLPLDRCCELANAAGAIVVSRHGCAPAMATWPEMEQFLARRDLPFAFATTKRWSTSTGSQPGTRCMTS